MNAVEMISLYGTLFYVSLGVALLGLALAVFFFFYFDIRTVYALMTGKAKADTIRRMNEQNQKTGNLRNAYIHTGPTGRTGKTTATASAVPAEAPEATAGQTAPLAPHDSMETTVLQQEDMAETTILQPEDTAETTVLGHSGIRFDLTESTLVIHTDEIIR